jgi:1-acyl-sn-glycerol-3-phosphate acyltransferase
MTRLRSILFTGLFYVWLVVIGLASAPLLLLPRRFTMMMIWCWSGGVLWLCRWVLGLRYRIEGRLPAADTPLVIAATHQSAWDTIVFLHLYRDPAYVLKKELLSLPIYGWFVRKSDMVPVDRSAGGAALREMVKRARQMFDQGRPVIIFPQGTRASPGAPVQMQPGVYPLYNQPGVRLVPIALDSGRFWGRRRFFKSAGCITLRVGEAIEPGLDRKRFMEQLERGLVLDDPAPGDPASGDPASGVRRSGS